MCAGHSSNCKCLTIFSPTWLLVQCSFYHDGCRRIISTVFININQCLVARSRRAYVYVYLYMCPLSVCVGVDIGNAVSHRLYLFSGKAVRLWATDLYTLTHTLTLFQFCTQGATESTTRLRLWYSMLTHP